MICGKTIAGSRRLRPGNRLALALAGCLYAMAAGFAGAQAAEVAQYFGITPGRTTRAQVELILGEPTAKSGPDNDIYTYAPARADADSSRVVLSYFDDTRTVQRVNVYLKTPLPADLLRKQFGTRVLSRDRNDGGREEFFLPKAYGVIFATRDPAAPAAAVSYLSPRFLAGLFVARGRTAEDEKKNDAAFTEYEKASQIDPQDAVPYLRMANILNDKKDRDKALLYYTAATNAAYPIRTKATAYYSVGILHYNDNQSGSALKAFNQALATDPSYAGGHYGIGLIHQSRDQWKDAMAAYKKAVEANPAWDAASHKLAFTALQALDFVSAERENRRRLGVEPKDATAMVYLAAALSSQAPERNALMALFQDEPRLKESLSWLDKAVAAGYRNKSVLEKSTHLRQLREQESQAFNEILSRIKPQ
jgi:tetratricopeptide (TPR) repeat protein